MKLAVHKNHLGDQIFYKILTVLKNGVFVLNAPLFKRKIEIVKSETILHSDDFDAPVYFLKFNQLKLKTKPEMENGERDRWRNAPQLKKETEFLEKKLITF